MGNPRFWDQPDFVARVDADQYFLPDAEEGERETMITSPIDARPLQVQRVPGPTFTLLVVVGFPRLL